MESLTAFLHAILHPRSVAVVGASSDSGKFGGRAMRFLVDHGYEGRIIAVNPAAEEVLGHTAYARIEDAPGPIDVALLAVPAPRLPSALEGCGRVGTKCCVVLTAEFAEIGEAGAGRERELVAIAHRYGMRLLGPNCLGYINPHERVALTSSVALAMKPMPKGAIGLVSQSGSLMAGMISHAQDAGTGFSACITVGNQADLEICDFIEYFIEDPATRVVCVYIEGLKNGRRFLDLAARCRTAGKPLLAVKAGRSSASVQIAQSHTASLAGSYEAWEAACRSEAVCLLDDPESMIQCAQFLLAFGAPIGDGVAAMSPSGGTIAITADRIVCAGLRLAQLSPNTTQELARIIPPSRPLNPLDIGGLPREQGLPSARAAQALIGADPDVAVTLIAVATTPQLEEKTTAWGHAALSSRKPTAILLTPGALVDGARRALRDIGCPYTNRMDDALRVVKAAIDYGHALRRPRSRPAAPSYIDAITAFSAALPAGRLTESEAKALVQSAGIASPPETLAHSVTEAVRAARAHGYPIAMKAVCRALVHKSDIGAVKLALSDDQTVEDAWRAIAHAVATHLPEARLEGCVVQPMVNGGVEMMIGARWDPSFGPIVIVGAGGVLVEILNDCSVELAPFTADRARDRLRELRVWPLLGGTRGQPAMDVESLVDAVVRIGWLAATLGEQLIELDLNPVVVQERGVLALDARATLAPRHS
ncbi:MAG TPA: acetate--CoA ligase family protein [Burkholderiales bacterium]|nr:acetate--CoA ligase family protein [Burkholderiales bacterium]